MGNQISPSPTAEKMLIIIANKLHVKMGELKPNTTWRELNVTEVEKEDLLNYIAKKFGIPVGPGIRVGLNNGKGEIIKDNWSTQIKNIKTIWNVLNFIESNDDMNGRPAAYNLN